LSDVNGLKAGLGNRKLANLDPKLAVYFRKLWQKYTESPDSLQTLHSFAVFCRDFQANVWIVSLRKWANLSNGRCAKNKLMAWQCLMLESGHSRSADPETQDHKA
jgi:hypothetical protein